MPEVKFGRLIFFFFLFILPLHFCLSQKFTPIEKWCILLDYEESVNDNDSVDILKKYDMIILDPDNHPPLDELRKRLLIAYLSCGEAENYRTYWNKIKDEPWIIGENPNWPGNFYVDISHPQWQNIILNEVIPKIINQGFRGLMLDTLDTASYLEDVFPDKYKGRKQVMVEMIKKIHTRYPQLYLISNNGFSILEKIAPYLSGALAEDITMQIDFKNGGYKRVDKSERQRKVKILTKIKKKYNLEIFTLDYVASGDKKMRKIAYNFSKRKGFHPYIAEKDLNRIYEN